MNKRDEEMSQALAREVSRRRRMAAAFAAAVDLGGLRSAVDLVVATVVGGEKESAGEGDTTNTRCLRVWCREVYCVFPVHA